MSSLKQDLSSPGKEYFNKLNQPGGQASAFSKLLSEQVFCRFTEGKEPQLQIISYMEGGEALPMFNSWSLYEENHELKHFC